MGWASWQAAGTATAGVVALDSGLTTFPQAIGVILASRFVGKWYQRVGPRRLLAVGPGGVAMASALFLLVDLDTSVWWIHAIMFLRGLFFACSIISLQAASFATISPADTGRASSLFSTIRQVGAAFGVALLATVLSTRTSTGSVRHRESWRYGRPRSRPTTTRFWARSSSPCSACSAPFPSAAPTPPSP